MKGIFGCVGAGILLAALAGCAALQRATPYLPTPDQIACAEVEADKGTPATIVLTKCGFAQDAIEIVEHLLLGHKKANARRAAARVGAPDASPQTVIILVSPADAGAEAGK